MILTFNAGLTVLDQLQHMCKRVEAAMDSESQLEMGRDELQETDQKQWD